MPPCEIEWNNLSLAAWEEHYRKVRRTSLLQSYNYARAVCPLQHQKPCWGLIRIEGREAGLVQILEASLFKNALHAQILDCGPLWFEGYGTEDHLGAFLDTLERDYPRRIGRRRRIIPACADTPGMRKTLEARGYKRLDRPGHQTIWLDLGRTEDELRTRLHQKWRNSLNKAEKSNLVLEWNRGKDVLPRFLKHYKHYKATKGFKGPPERLLQSLGHVFGVQNNLLIGNALLDMEPVAAILILCHGRAATYQASWSSAPGRHLAAHNLLLWQGILKLKEQGIYDFDLGGINDETGKGVKRFKEGLGGDILVGPGHFI